MTLPNSNVKTFHSALCWMVYNGDAFATTWFFIVALAIVFFSELSLIMLPASVTLKCQRLAFIVNGLEREMVSTTDGAESHGDQNQSASTQRNVNMRTAVQLINLRQVRGG
jgi:hypothetical protein